MVIGAECFETVSFAVEFCSYNLGLARNLNVCLKSALDFERERTML